MKIVFRRPRDIETFYAAQWAPYTVAALFKWLQTATDLCLSPKILIKVRTLKYSFSLLHIQIGSRYVCSSKSAVPIKMLSGSSLLDRSQRCNDRPIRYIAFYIHRLCLLLTGICSRNIFLLLSLLKYFQILFIIRLCIKC